LENQDAALLFIGKSPLNEEKSLEEIKDLELSMVSLKLLVVDSELWIVNLGLAEVTRNLRY
jgi:hypothetical protein